MTNVFKSAYSKKTRVHPVPAGEAGDSLAKQSMAAECNINSIMKQYQKTGAVSHLNRHGAEYAFCSGDGFDASMRIVVKAQEMFADLPSSVRERFGGDPRVFLDFVQDDANLEEMRELGLALPVEETGRQAPAPISEPVAAPVAAPAAVEPATSSPADTVGP